MFLFRFQFQFASEFRKREKETYEIKFVRMKERTKDSQQNFLPKNYRLNSLDVNSLLLWKQHKSFLRLMLFARRYLFDDIQSQKKREEEKRSESVRGKNRVSTVSTIRYFSKWLEVIERNITCDDYIFILFNDWVTFNGCWLVVRQSSCTIWSFVR